MSLRTDLFRALVLAFLCCGIVISHRAPVVAQPKPSDTKPVASSTDDADGEADATDEEFYAAQHKLTKLPKNSSAVRLRNRCSITGRPRAYLRKYGVSRITFRELASEGKIPGVTKSSW